VTSKVEKCKEGDNLCVCAVYIRINDALPRYAFIDHCYEDNSIKKELQYFDDSYINKIKSGKLPNINCNNYINDDTNDREWENIPFSFGNFKCAIKNNTICSPKIVNPL
jgi:hypothetical protein